MERVGLDALDLLAEGGDGGFDFLGVLGDDGDLFTLEFQRAIGDIGFDFAIDSG